MATPPKIPAITGHLVDASRLATPAWYGWFLRIQAALDAGTISDAEATALIQALTLRLDAVEQGGTAAQLLAAMYGTNGVQVYGSVETGVEIRGPGVPAAPTAAGMHMLFDADPADSWPIPGPKGASGSGGLTYANATIPGGNTIASTAAETAFSSSYTIPANDLAVGDVLRLKLWGTYSTDIIAPTITGKVKFGSVVMLNTGALTTIAGVTNAGWTAEASFIVQSIGGSGAIDAQGSAFFATAATTTLSAIVANTATIAVDTTATVAVTVTITWSASSASNTITLRQMILEKMRA